MKNIVAIVDRIDAISVDGLTLRIRAKITDGPSSCLGRYITMQLNPQDTKAILKLNSKNRDLT